MINTNVITIERNIPIPTVIGRRGSTVRYNFMKTMQINDSFCINGNTPDFNPVSVRAYVYGLNADRKTSERYAIRTVAGLSDKPTAIRVWRTA